MVALALFPQVLRQIALSFADVARGKGAILGRDQVVL